MILHNVHIIAEHGTRTINILNTRIDQIIASNEFSDPGKSEFTIEFDDAIAFPGIINSHDHLEFNLFPKLGNRIYKNYMEWGPDIHKQNKDVIAEVKKIPKQLRAEWGMYKNLLNGITTVVHHGEHVKIEDPLIDIFQECYSPHSVRLERYLKLKLNNPFLKKWPWVIHVGEGTDTSAYEEINELIRWNFLKKDLIAVHGVAMDINQAKKFKALIWCPDSNLFLLNATARVNELKNELKIIFGTDSAVSASWSIWDQIRLAKNLNLLSDKEIFDSLTKTPAVVWKLSDKGTLTNGKTADIVVAKMKDKSNSLNSFFQTNPEDILLVIKNGEIVLFDEVLKSHLTRDIIPEKFDKVFSNNKGKYIKGRLKNLIDKIKSYSSEINVPVGLE